MIIMPKKRVGIRALTCFAESKNLEMAFALMRSANVIEERGYSIRTKRVSLIDNAFEESMIEMILRSWKITQFGVSQLD